MFSKLLRKVSKFKNNIPTLKEKIFVATCQGIVAFVVPKIISFGTEILEVLIWYGISNKREATPPINLYAL